MDASALASAESWLSVLAIAKLIAAALVAAGVAIEFGSDWVARPYERVVKEARDKETAQLRDRTAQAELETIRIKERLAARTLTDAEVAEIGKQLSEFSGQTFEIIAYWDSKESLDIATRIADALTLAGWKIDQPKRYTALLGVVVSVFVNVDEGAPEKTHAAAEALVKVLNDKMIAATLKELPNLPDKAKLNLSVGIKP